MSIPAKRRRAARLGAAAILPVLIAVAGAFAETGAPPTAGSAAATADNAILLTIFLKHDQSRPLGESGRSIGKTGILQSVPSAWHRGPELVYRNGNRPGHHASPAGVAFERG